MSNLDPIVALPVKKNLPTLDPNHSSGEKTKSIHLFWCSDRPYPHICVSVECKHCCLPSLGEISCRGGTKADDYLRSYVSECVNVERRLSLVSGDPELPQHHSSPRLAASLRLQFFFFLLRGTRVYLKINTNFPAR